MYNFKNRRVWSFRNKKYLKWKKYKISRLFSELFFSESLFFLPNIILSILLQLTNLVFQLLVLYNGTRLLIDNLKSFVAFSQEQEKECKTLIEYLKVLMDITSDEIGLHSTERNDNFLIMSYDKKATLIIVFQANEHIISWKTFFSSSWSKRGETKSLFVPSWNKNVWMLEYYMKEQIWTQKKINFELFYFRYEMGSVSHVKWHHVWFEK